MVEEKRPEETRRQRRAPLPVKKKPARRTAAVNPVLEITPAMVAVFGALTPLTFLQRESVTPAAGARYRVVFLRLLAWARLWGFQLRTVEEVEEKVPLYLEELYAEDEPVSTGDYVLAALAHFVPRFSVRANCGLPRCRQALKGWRRKRPAASRLPLPWEVVALLANWMVLTHRWEAAVVLLITFQGYFRPGEPFKLRVRDAVPPVAGSSGRHWALILHPLELGVASKTKAYDETSIIDLPEFQFLGVALARLQAGRDPDQPLFRLPAAAFLSILREGAAVHDLDRFISRVVPYRLRHGGASFDIAAGKRTLAEVGRRGRWRTAASVRRYEKGGRVGQLLNQLPSHLRSHALLCAERIGDVVLGSRPPLVLVSRGR